MHATPFLPGLSPVGAKSLTATFDAGRLSSDGGLVVLREVELRLGLAETMTAPLADDRDQTRVLYSYAAMARARMLMIAAGYEDCDYIDTLKADPALKLACGRCPDTGADLMSQPTLSRLENAPDWRTLVRIGLGLIDLYCRSFRTPPKHIVLDIDDTDDPVHGQQELALFNAHYDCTCFQPIHIFDGVSGKPILALLRPGKRPSGEEVAKVLRHVIRRIRKHWPRVEILVRADSHYCSEPALALLEALDCDYIVGFSINARLAEIAAPWREQCAIRRCWSRPVVRRFHQLPYRAQAWARSRKVIARVEATSLGTDARFVVTNLEGRGKTLYEKVFCARGQAENLIKDMKRFTRSDKTACSRWEANQFRLFLHMGAYWLLHSLRAAAPKRSRWRGATFETIRRTFVKIAVRVEEMKGKIRLAFPASYPQAAMLAAMTGAITTRGP
ncbi:MAG TPA: IS1380 family transposase [Burkholderiales bacterium]|nr:IS1380 family transposase [Burkholderiales bacterium]